MKPYEIVLLLLSVFLFGCAAIDGGPGQAPTDIPDGINTYQFVYKAPFLFDRNFLDVTTTYTGNWVGSRPKGQGQATNNYGRKCSGLFGINADATARVSNGSLNVLAIGDVYSGNTRIYSGVFQNDFMSGESCVPHGEGIWWTARWDIAGEMTGIVDSRHQSDVILLSNYLKEGSCSISLKDGTRYTGFCKGPAAYPSINGWISLDRLDDPLILATPSGQLTDPSGRTLSDSERHAVLDSIQRALAAKTAHQEQEAAAAASEARRQRLEQAEEDARQSAINRQGLLAIAGSVAIGQGMMGKNYSDAQRAAVVDAWTKDRVNAAQGITTDNLSEAAASTRPALTQATQPRPGFSGSSSGSSSSPSGGRSSSSGGSVAVAQASKSDSDLCAERGMRRSLAPSYTDPAGYWGLCRETNPYEAGNGWKYAVDTNSTGASAGPLDSRSGACNEAQQRLKVWESSIDRGVVITQRSPCVCRTGDVEFRNTSNPNGWVCGMYVQTNK